MKAIVTGGAGFIGRHLVNRLLADGWDVIAVDNLSNRSNFDGLSHDRLQKHEIAAQFFVPDDDSNVDAIFHLAGKVGPLGVMTFAGHIANDTVWAASQMGALAWRYKCPLIFTSTSEVYGSPDDANSETTPKVFQGPHSARQEYAASKFASEVMLLNRDIDVRIIRPFNVTGPGQQTRGGFVLPRFVQQGLKGERLTVYAPGTQMRAFTHVEDIVEGFIKAYTHGTAKQAYNLGNEENACSIYQLAQEVNRALGLEEWNTSIIDPRSIHGPDFREAPDKLPNSYKARALLGWHPTKSRAAIIEDVIKYERGKL